MSGTRAGFIKRAWKTAMNRRNRKRTIRYFLFASNIAVLAVVAGFVITSSNNLPATQHSSSVATGSSTEENPLDPLSSADIAVHVARMTRLPEATAVVNEADSANALLAVASTDDNVIAKPQVISESLKSIKDLQTYVTVNGDTVSSIAAKFGITSNSIRWSNDLTGDSVEVGKELWIPPLDGIVYVAKANDTPESLATKYKANKDQIIAFNDIEVTGLQVGRRIVIPSGTVAAVRAPVTTSYTSFAYGFTPTYGFNGYDPGWCTWYVASRIAIPTNWGNANTWDNYAALSGWIVSKSPVVGAIGQTDAGWAGHVGIVEAVSADGTMIKYSDMNGIAGFNRVGYSDWVPISRFQNYIYH